MYAPKYSLTPEVIDNLSDIDSDRENILGSLIQPKIDISLKMEAIIQSVYASTVDDEDDEPLSYDDVRILIRAEKRLIREKREKKAINYYNVLKNIDEYHNNGIITEELILKIHKDITNGLLEETFFEGSYRNTNNSIQNRRTGKVRYTPPKHENVPKLMKDLIEWINTDSNSLHSVVAAGMVHYELVRIHPFVNGNGRTARALASLILCLRSFDIKKYFALDEHYNLDKKVYVDALKSADESGDLTRWLEYFTEGVLISVHKVFKMISELPTMVNNPVELTEDQIKVVNYVLSK